MRRSFPPGEDVIGAKGEDVIGAKGEDVIGATSTDRPTGPTQRPPGPAGGSLEHHTGIARAGISQDTRGG
jgi:hypothetical protein